jgi:hypothetical protein
MGISSSLKQQVRARAANTCEYCQIYQDDLPYAVFHIEHVIARQHAGTDEFENLALSCHWCNLHKGTNLSTMVDNILTPIFNPRSHAWSDHFQNKNGEIVGITNIGKGTVRLLQMNDEERLELRQIK